MGFDKVKIKQIRGIIIFLAVIVLLIMYSGSVFKGLQLFLGILTPFVAGGAIAFVLNIPLKLFENRIFKWWNGKVAKKIKRPICILLSIVFVAAIVAFVAVTVVPKLNETFSLLGVQVPIFVKETTNWLYSLADKFPQIAEWMNELEINKIDWKSIFNYAGTFLSTGMTNVISSAYAVATSIIGGVINTLIAFIFAIYVLIQKEKLENQGHRLLTAYTPEKVSKRAEKVMALLYRNFSHFISGQCIEAVILGSLFFIFMSIFRFPYALLISVLIAFLALIPAIGAFIGCFIGAFLLLMNDPLQALWFIVLFLVIQQIEANLIYPHVVGSSVGLPSIWVLVAVTIGGSLFGVVGMLCFIPLVSTGYALMKENINNRNTKKEELKREALEKAKKEQEDKEKSIENEEDPGSFAD